MYRFIYSLIHVLNTCVHSCTCAQVHASTECTCASFRAAGTCVSVHFNGNSDNGFNKSKPVYTLKETNASQGGQIWLSHISWNVPGGMKLGKPMQGTAYDHMRKSKRQYLYAVQRCERRTNNKVHQNG